MKELLHYLFQITDDKANWFAPLHPALEGLSESQACWKPEWSAHSVAGLTAHLHFYQQRELARFRGVPDAGNQDNNDSTFAAPAPGGWEALVGDTLRVLKEWREEIRGADEQKLASAAELIADLATHLAYHTGQIILLRKCQGSWNPDKGVK